MYENKRNTQSKLIVLLVLAAEVMFGAGGVKAQGTLAGDANGDSHVDGIDYVVWLTHIGQTCQ